MARRQTESNQGVIKTVHKLINQFQLQVKKIREEVEEPNEELRNLAFDFLAKCVANPKVSEEDLKRVDKLCDRIMKMYPVQKSGRPRDLDIPASSARLTDIDDMIDENYEPEEITDFE